MIAGRPGTMEIDLSIVRFLQRLREGLVFGQLEDEFSSCRERRLQNTYVRLGITP